MNADRHIRTFAAASALCLMLSPVSAQEPGEVFVAQPAACEFVSSLGRFLGAEDYANPPGIVVVQEIYPDVMQDGLAYFEVQDLRGQNDGSQWIVLQHCPTSQDLLVRLGDNGEAVRTRIWDLLVATEEHTMSEVATILTDLGATTEIGDAHLGACPCEHQQFYFGN